MNPAEFYRKRLPFLDRWQPEHLAEFTRCLNAIIAAPFPASAEGVLQAIGVIAFDNESADHYVMPRAALAAFVLRYGIEGKDP